MKDIECTSLRILLFITGIALLSPAIARGIDGGFSYGGTDGKSSYCLACHAQPERVGNQSAINTTEYEHTTHARIGCITCHDGMRPDHATGLTNSAKPDCSECHSDVKQENARSKHAAKASCGDCHNPHRVSAPVEISGEQMNRMCLRCHDDRSMEARHARWLPQADLHMDMLPCVTCHTASEKYLINLYIIKRQGDNPYGEFNLATYEELEKLARGKDIRSLIDTNGDSYISLAELRLFNQSRNHRMLRLQGVMVPEKVTHDFQTLENRWDCTFCHASGPEAMQRSTLALPQRNGTFSRMTVEQGAVLEALGTTPDFYMTGATRNHLLNKVGLAIIAGGLVMPVGHGFLRFLTRKYRRERSHRHE